MCNVRLCCLKADSKLYVITCRKGLSLHAILFGPKTTSARMERMVTVALDAQSETPALTSALSSFHEALDSVGRFSCFEMAICSIHVFTGPTLTDFPWDRRIIEKTQRSINAVINRSMPCLLRHSCLYICCSIRNYVSDWASTSTYIVWRMIEEFNLHQTNQTSLVLESTLLVHVEFAVNCDRACIL